MSKWISNLKTILNDRSVVLLHGNVRDRYIDEDGQVFENLTALLRSLANQPASSFTNAVFYDYVGGERQENIQKSESRPVKPAKKDEFSDTQPNRESSIEGTPARILARWARELSEPFSNRFAVIFYLDKLVPYKTSYTEDERECLLWLEKIVENITTHNRLIMVALRDTM